MKTTTALLLGLALLPAPAFAASLDDVLAHLGAEANRTGDEVRVPEMVLSSGDLTVTLTDVLAQQDGEEVVLSPEGDIRLAFTTALSRSVLTQDPEAPEEVTREFLITAPEATLRISDLTDDTLVGTLDAPEIDLSTDYEDAVTDLTAEVRGLTADFFLDGTPGGESRVAFRQEGTVYAVSDPETETEGTLGAAQGTFAMVLPANDMKSYATPFEAVADGFRTSATLDLAGMTQEMTAEDIGFSTEDGPITVAMKADQDGILLNATATGGSLVSSEGNGAGYDYGASDFSMKLPAMTEGSDGFHIRMNAAEIAPNAAAWEMIDAAGTLDREPLNLRLGLAGTVADLAGQTFGALTAPTPTLRDLTLEVLEISGMGARVSGAGEMTISEETGMPENGELSLSLKGVTQLIDGLVAAGIVPAAEANSLRMPLAMFAKPVSDTESVIEVKVVDGKTSLNGAPLN